jgi:diketogulonate reductase-like aldo/keto reductase
LAIIFLQFEIQKQFLSHSKTSLIFPQVEIHPHYPQSDLVEFCRKNDIHIQAYSSLGTTVANEANPLLNDDCVKNIAEKYGKTPGFHLFSHF